MNPPIFDRLELAALIEAISPSKNHRKLIKELQTRYPGNTFKVAAVRDGIYRAGGIVTEAGERYAASTEQWLKAEYDKAGKNAYKVWQAWKDEPLIATEHHLDHIYLAVQYGLGPADFVQIELFQIQEMAEHRLFDNAAWNSPLSFRDLYDGFKIESMIRGKSVEYMPIGTPRYEFREATDIAKFVQEAQALDIQKRIARIPQLQRKTITVIETGPGAGPARQEPFFDHAPDYLRYQIGVSRLMEDWAESSAGRSGQVFSDHWSLQLSDYEHGGERHMDAIPVWVTTKRLPEIRYKGRMSYYDLIDKLEKLDEKTGVPFAWFFFMTHGNRVTSTEGEIIYKAVKRGLFKLPDQDFVVLERWHEKPYAF